MSDRRVRVLVAEDQPIVRDGLAALVGYQSDMEVVGLGTPVPLTYDCVRNP